MIFVARYNDGRCGIAEAENEEQERKLLQSEEMRFDPEQDQIISVRPLITPFASRWFFEDLDSDDFVEIDRLSGLLGFNVAEEILQHEYPMIATAHATCEREEPLLDVKADQTTPSSITDLNLSRWQSGNKTWYVDYVRQSSWSCNATGEYQIGLE